MFKNIEESPILQATRKSEKNNGFYIVKNYINNIPRDYPIIKVEEKIKFVGLVFKRGKKFWFVKFYKILENFTYK